MTSFQRGLLLATVALYAIPAAAQTAPAEPGATAGQSLAAAEEIVVTGRRPIAESEAAALAVQRESPSLVSVAAADAVGRLPDQNIAQAVSRLPGISAERDQGQARYLNVRGAPRNWATLSFDGVTIVSPEGRDSRYDSIPSAIASQIVVRKAVTPDMTGETIAGNVDIITRSALDYAGLHVQGRLGAGHVFLGDYSELDTSLVVSNRWDTGVGELGVLVSGSYYGRGIATDNLETDWEPVSQDVRPGGFPDRLFARETERKYYRATRRNYSGTVRLDWRPSTDHRIFASSIYTAFTDSELRDNYIFDLDDQQGSTATAAALRLPCPATAPTVPPVGTTGYADACLNSSLQGTVYGIDINTNILVRRFIQSIFTNTVGGDHAFGEGWKLRWRANYTRSLDDRSAPAQFNFDSPNFANAALRPTVQYDFTDPQRPRVALFRTVRAANGQLSRGDAVNNIQDFALPLARARSLDANDETKAYTAKFDLSRDTDFLGDTRFQVGAQYDNRTKTAVENLLDLNVSNAGQNAIITAAGIPITLAPYTNDTGYLGKVPLDYQFRYFDKDFLIAQRDRLLAAGGTRTPQVLNNFDVEEEIFAAYASALTRGDWGSALIGARIEHTKNRSAATGQVTRTVNGATTTVAIPLSVERSRTLVFPNANLNFDLRDDVKLRFAFSTGAARPDYDVLRPNVVINDANLTISGGNPDAKPEYALGGDAYLEWYVQPAGYVALGVFYKHIRDVLFTTSSTVGSDAFNFDGVDRSGYRFSRLSNGGTGKLYGLEAALQLQLDPFIEGTGVPAWLGGFGISTNVVLNRGDATTPDGRKVQFPGTSRTTYNLGAYYEKYGLSVRVQYQKRTPWLDGLGGRGDQTNGLGVLVPNVATDGGDFFWATDDELDISARYAFTPNFEIYVDAANVLNGPGRRYVRESRFTIERETFGARLTGGVRFQF